MKNERPNISVIIPTLNRSSTLPRALDSVLKQSVLPYEIIVVDNGSTDATAQIMRCHYSKIQFLYERKVGVSATRNFGIRVAKGNWIALLDSDDEWFTNKLERQIEELTNCPESIRLVHTNEIWKKNNVFMNQLGKHKKTGGSIFKECLRMCCISPSSSMIRKDVFADIGYFDEKLPACEDYDLWLRICAKEDVLFIDENLIVKHGGHNDQLSRKYWAMDRFRVYALEKLLETGDLCLENQNATYKMLVKKLDVLIKGGKNRGNMSLVDFYREKKDFWTRVTKGSKNIVKKNDLKIKEIPRYYFD